MRRFANFFPDSGFNKEKICLLLNAIQTNEALHPSWMKKASRKRQEEKEPLLLSKNVKKTPKDQKLFSLPSASKS
jgi:hypothetical protein